MATTLPGMEMTTASQSLEQARTNAFELRDIVNLYLQQSAAANQLWAMYAATTFAAGVFAFRRWR